MDNPDGNNVKNDPRAPKTVSVTTLGCKSNQYDSIAIEERLRAGGFDIVEFPGRSDAYVINTCTVTANTDAEARSVIRRARRLNPDAVVLVTGCYATVSTEEVGSISGVDYVIGNAGKDRIPEYLEKGGMTGEAAPAVFKTGTPLLLRALSSGRRTRAILKVQDGCNKRCSYCIIPMARGASRSLSLSLIEREMDMLLEKGYKEIVLTGIHLGAYGMDLSPASGIIELLSLIEKKDAKARFRISSLDPEEVTPEFIAALKGSKNICNHLHLSLQSGDNGIIREMQRPYTAEIFKERVLGLADAVPDISIGVDVIAGHPGEGDKEFENTLSLLDGLPVSYLHVFPFSRRKGTPASAARDQVRPSVIKERCGRLKRLDAGKREAFYARFIGKEAEVLIEGKKDEAGLYWGKTRNYMPVRVERGHGHVNEIVLVKLKGLSNGALIADIIG